MTLIKALVAEARRANEMCADESISLTVVAIQFREAGQPAFLYGLRQHGLRDCLGEVRFLAGDDAAVSVRVARDAIKSWVAQARREAAGT